MTRTPLWRLAAASALVLSLFLSACASSAPNFRGRWKPVNQLPETPVAIPLYEAYVYSVGPMDKTLKQLLTRWAHGSKSSLSYLHPNDYTLYAAVGDIHTTDLQQAIGQLNSAYAAYDLVISAGGGQITVRSGAQPSTDTAETSASSSGTP